MGRWTPASIRGPKERHIWTCIPSRCRTTGRFWRPAGSPRWAGRAAITLAGSTRTGRSTRASIRGRTMSCIPWRCRRTGRFWWGGEFTTLGGQSRIGIGRLNADGTLDTGFDPGAGGGAFSHVRSLALQTDGRILVGRWSSPLGDQSHTNISRLNPDGTPDTSFKPEAGVFFQNVYALAVQADGKILVGGLFSTLGGQSRYGLGRLNADGTLDASFSPALGLSCFDGCLAVVY